MKPVAPPALPQENWGELGPAMRDLSEIQRLFVRYYLVEVTRKPYGAQTRAARRAGYKMTGATLSKHAHELLKDPTRNEKIIAALNEEARKITRGAGYAEAVVAALKVRVRDPTSRDHGENSSTCLWHAATRSLANIWST